MTRFQTSTELLQFAEKLGLLVGAESGNEGAVLLFRFLFLASTAGFIWGIVSWIQSETTEDKEIERLRIQRGLPPLPSDQVWMMIRDARIRSRHAGGFSVGSEEENAKRLMKPIRKAYAEGGMEGVYRLLENAFGIELPRQ